MKPTALQGAAPAASCEAALLRAPAAPPAPPSPRPQPPGQPGAARSGPTLLDAGTVAVLVLADLKSAARFWGWSRLVLGGLPLRHLQGLRFSKVLGSGAEGGFGLKPSGTHQGLFLGFADEDAAQAFVDRSPVMAGYRARARELCVIVLRAFSSKGSWSGAAMALTAGPPSEGPIAALTRASIRPRHALAFWRLSPPAEAALAGSEGCLLTAGLGEAPVLRQATFSLWRSVADMDRYARGGAHQAAIRAAYGGGYFSESMFVRFVPLRIEGTWQGVRHG